MVKKDQKQEWTNRQEEIFRELKKRFTKELVSAVPDLDRKMRMEIDVSNYAIEVLSMECKDGKQLEVRTKKY